MRRRDFTKLIAVGGTFVWPLAVRAQQGERVRRVGVFMTYAEHDPEAKLRVAALHDGLKKSGWTEDVNIRTDYRYVTDTNAIANAAADLVREQPDVIVVNSNSGTAALRQETRTVPIVFVLITDPVGSGFVESLAHPNGNATGFTNYEYSMGGKWLELLKQIAPLTVQVGVVFHPDTPANVGILRSAETSASALHLNVTPLPVRDATEIETVVAKFAGGPKSGLLIVPHPVTLVNRELLGRLTARYELPAVFAHASFAKAGGLISYGIGAPDAFKEAASYVDRILKGERPSDLPVQQPTKFELVINLKTAKALGLSVPSSLLATADEVIE